MADLEQAQRFLSWLDPSASEFAFQTFDDRPKAKRKTLSKLVHGDTNGTLDQLILFNDRGAGIFVTINETDGEGRSVKHIKRVRCIFVDLDGSPLEPVMQCDHRPHCVIETSPGKYQAYWRVDDVPLGQFTNIQRAFAKKFKGDNVIDLSRVMRVPGFEHKKGEPFEVKIVHLDDDEPSYHISEILTEVEIEEATEHSAPINGSADPFLKAITTLEAKKGGWHDAMRTFTGSMVSMGHVPKVIERLAVSYTWPGYSVDETLKEVRVMVNGARSKGWAPQQTKPVELKRALPAPEFPIDVLPKTMRELCEDQAEHASCPIDFFAIPRLVEVAGCIGAAPRIRPTPDWLEPICLWAMIVADPGSMKSAALKRATRVMREIDKEYQKEYMEALEEYQEKIEDYEDNKKQAKKNGDLCNIEEPQPPAHKHIYVSDPTIEALVNSMPHSPGMTLVKDELSAWALNMSRYSNGTDVGHYLEMYSGGSIKVMRLSRQSVYVPESYLNIVGGIQPEVAKKIFDPQKRNDDGLFDRFGLIAYPEPKAYRVSTRAPNYGLLDRYRSVCEKLHAQHWGHVLIEGDKGPPYARLSADAQKEMNAWLNKNGDEGVANRENAVSGFMSKSRGLVSRLTFTIHAFRVASGEAEMFSEVDVASLHAAIRLYETYCVPMYRRVLGEFGYGQEARAETLLWEVIQRRGYTDFLISDITRDGLKGLGDKNIVRSACYGLVDAGHLYQKEQNTSKKGRPSTRFYVSKNDFGQNRRANS